MKLCGKPMPKAKNGVDRGVCTRIKGHAFGNHGNRTCTVCGDPLSSLNAKPSVADKGCGMCRVCNSQWHRARLGLIERNNQRLGAFHKFPCGCSGVLPEKREHANMFVVRASKTGSFGCRVSSIIYGSQASAKRDGHLPIPKDTPHYVIRAMMSEPNCWLCDEAMCWAWAIPLGVRQPHLHHDHDTGEIHGFTHPVCNPRAMQREIERLKGLLRKSA